MQRSPREYVALGRALETIVISRYLALYKYQPIAIRRLGSLRYICIVNVSNAAIALALSN